ncbi:MAG: hypothetical protein LUD50_08130 [Clostridia bacterium]|nr:hypothetical protein [Clostridia bacterium]
MANKYADIIKIREGKPAYNIIDEEESEWKTFIPNKQFNKVLSIVLDSVRCQKIDLHKSFWINGTYGTGKSHAASVIAHLLGDSVEEIREWVDYEYREEEYELIRNSVYSLRKEKRLLPVRIKGRENLTHVSELASLIQTKVTKSLEQHNIDIVVQTDYDNLITHINNHADIWTPLIERDSDLHTFAGNKEQLIKKLRGRDSSILQKARSALRKAGIQIMLQQENLENWLIDIQEKLRQATTYKGLLIMWDEFTEVMEDAIGIPVLKALQTVAERFMTKSNDSFIFLISHPSAFNTLGTEATRQTDGRYHRMKYNMESVSAFKIMSRKFVITDEEQYKKAQDSFYSRNDNLLKLYTEKSNDKEETKRDLINLFPLHPGTANLATHYATTVGSSSRSVFEFIGGNEAMSKFLNNEQAFTKEETITADFLWDFVLKEFQDDIGNYGPVTERFNTYRQTVEEHGKAATAIFKAILLLNAFNNVAADKSVAPTEVNISLLFQGTKYEEEVASCLNWINENGIIQKSPMGAFSVQFSALPAHETEKKKVDSKKRSITLLPKF